MLVFGFYRCTNWPKVTLLITTSNQDVTVAKLPKHDHRKAVWWSGCSGKYWRLKLVRKVTESAAEIHEPNLGS